MRTRLTVLVVALALGAPALARAGIPETAPDAPVLGAQVARGGGLITSFDRNVAPAPKTVDGNIDDWTGDISRYAGTSIYSRGEFVYQDYVNDNWGADDGHDETRAQTTDELNRTEPRTYKLEALAQVEGEQDPAGAGCPEQVPGELCGVGNYGNVEDSNIRRETDLEEVRVAADATNVYVLARTAEMTTDSQTGVLVLFGGGTNFPGNPAPGGVTTATRKWVFASGDTFHQTSNITGARVATNSAGYTNAVEISVPRALVDNGGDISLAVATCYVEGSACKSVHKGDARSDLMNVAFRGAEPARIWMDHDQSFMLHDGDIDSTMTTVNLGRLGTGYTETFEPRYGYWERVYATDSPVNSEAQNSGSYFQGKFQHYGVYLPSNFRARTSARYPTTWWTHYRGGHAHDAAAWVPGLVRQFGEQKGNIMIFPSARGTSSWYVGRGMEDFLDVWDDSARALPIDTNRVYMTGYSMGGFASWLLPTLMPDRFAGSSPTEGPATQGLLVAPGVVSQPQNGGDVEAENTYNLLENARNVAYAIYNGNTDELVWITGIAAMHAKLTQLGYNNRLYQIDGGEHYASAVLDSWTEAANYLNEFRRDPNPPHVTYRTWPAIEHAVSTISTLPGQDLGYRFNSAYWVSGLEARAVRISGGKPNPADWGTIDATTNGRGSDTFVGVPEAGAGLQGSAYQMTGWRNIKTGRAPAANTFTATLTNLRAATLDVARMGLATSNVVEGEVSTDGDAILTLKGRWARAPRVELCAGTNCAAIPVTFDWDGISVDLGTTVNATLRITP
jgi:dienelactone hydrolase